MASTAAETKASGVHRFTVAEHSLHKGSRAYISSMPFAVGGHEWVIDYYPDGDSRGAGTHISVYLRLLGGGGGGEEEDRQVRTSFSFSLQDPGSPAKEKHRVNCSHDFSSKIREGWGYSTFLTKAALDASGCLKDDRLVIKCAVEVLVTGDAAAKPPSDDSGGLHSHLGRLLETGVGADTTVTDREGRTFMAHRCVLASRSPVLRRHLSKRNVSETKTARYSIHIGDMDGRAVEALLRFIYTDSLPGFMDDAGEEARNTAQQLVAAADRYAMKRLKLACEDKLMKALDHTKILSEFAKRGPSL